MSKHAASPQQLIDKLHDAREYLAQAMRSGANPLELGHVDARLCEVLSALKQADDASAETQPAMGLTPASLIAQIEQLKQEVREHETNEQRLAELVDQLEAEKAARPLTDGQVHEAVRILRLWLEYASDRSNPRAVPFPYRVTELFLSCTRAIGASPQPSSTSNAASEEAPAFRHNLLQALDPGIGDLKLYNPAAEVSIRLPIDMLRALTSIVESAPFEEPCPGAKVDVDASVTSPYPSELPPGDPVQGEASPASGTATVATSESETMKTLMLDAIGEAIQLAPFEEWTRRQGGYNLARNETHFGRTYQDEKTEHAWRGWACGRSNLIQRAVSKATAQQETSSNEGK